MKSSKVHEDYYPTQHLEEQQQELEEMLIDSSALIEKQSLAIIHQLQEICCRNELYHYLVFLLGAPQSQEEKDGYYDDVEHLIQLYYEQVSEYKKIYSTTTQEQSNVADKHENITEKEFVTNALDQAMNSNSDNNNNNKEHESDVDGHSSEAIAHRHIEVLYNTLYSFLNTTFVEKSLAVGALELAEEERQAAEAELKRSLAQSNDGRAEDKLSTSAAERKRAMQVSPEEMFRMAQLVRSGLADEAELLSINQEGERTRHTHNSQQNGHTLESENTNDTIEDVEINEAEPMFLKRAGLKSVRKRINYRALLPSQQLREAQTPQQRQAIRDRQAQRMQRDWSTLNSMERIAEMQVKINADRRMIARRAHHQQQQQQQHEINADTITNNKMNNDGKTESALRITSSNQNNNVDEYGVDEMEHRHDLLLHTELDEKPEEPGFGPRTKLSKLPPWLRHSVGLDNVEIEEYNNDNENDTNTHKQADKVINTNELDKRNTYGSGNGVDAGMRHKSSNHGGSASKLFLTTRAGATIRFGLPKSHASLHEQRMQLPIYAQRERILNYVDTHSVTILVGETGSGKTTQIPQYLCEHGYAREKMICCTQPRRVAAETLAVRVAEEYGCRVGEEVGYTVRFRDVTSSLTRIKYVTDGMLLREALLDDSFKRYSVIILDEAHERSINTDLLFAIVREALKKHKELKVMITSATLEVNKFCTYFGVRDGPLMIEGRTFPVDTFYLAEPTTDYVRTALETVMKIHLEEPPGDVLVFFTGQEEIDLAGEQLFDWITLLRERVSVPLPDMLILPLTATMPQEVQSRVFEPTPQGTRKVILATNVAETSITITNLYFVIDSGYCKQNIFDPQRNVEQLRVVPISQAQANQRRGRAGRIGPGKCFRIYTEIQYRNDMVAETVPDIMRASLFHVTLQLKAMGLDLLYLDLLDNPSVEAVVAALEKLRYLGALDDDGLLTTLGGQMAQLSIDPSQSKTLLTAVKLGCSEPVLTIVSMLAVQRRGVFYRPRDKQEAADASKRQFAQPEGDQITLMAVYDAWVANGMSEEWSRAHFLKHRMLVEARDTRDQLKNMLLQRCDNIHHHNDDNLIEIRRALTAGYFFNAARRIDSYARSYVVLADRKEVYIHPSSVLNDNPPKYVLFDDVRLTSREYMTELLVIEPKWLVELAPDFFVPPRKGRRLTRTQEAERFIPILKSWETGNSWRISRLKKRRR